MEQENQNLPNVHNAHRGMPNGAVVAAIVVFVLLVVGMFVFAYLKRAEQSKDAVLEEQTRDEVVDGAYAHITRVDATHYFIDGLHTLVGEILMPTPCDLLDRSVVIAESYPEQVMIDFTVINNSDVCTQVITPARFKVEANVSEDALFKARFMGRDIELNLIPAPEGDRPEDFEVFQKG